MCLSVCWSIPLYLQICLPVYQNSTCPAIDAPAGPAFCSMYLSIKDDVRLMYLNFFTYPWVCLPISPSLSLCQSVHLFLSFYLIVICLSISFHPSSNLSIQLLYLYLSVIQTSIHLPVIRLSTYLSLSLFLSLPVRFCPCMQLSLSLH